MNGWPTTELDGCMYASLCEVGIFSLDNIMYINHMNICLITFDLPSPHPTAHTRTGLINYVCVHSGTMTLPAVMCIDRLQLKLLVGQDAGNLFTAVCVMDFHLHALELHGLTKSAGIRCNNSKQWPRGINDFCLVNLDFDR